MFACGGGNICYNDNMNKIVNVLKKYMYIVAIFLTMSIVLSVTYSNFIVTSNNHKAAEMYIGELKYSMTINGSVKNKITLYKNDKLVFDIKISNLNSVDTYYKLLYLNNANVTIKYYKSTKDTDDVVTTYNKPSDQILSDSTNSIKLLIINNSSSSQEIEFAVNGGYIINNLSDIIVPSTYSEITAVDTSSNLYFCKTENGLSSGEYTNGQYTYSYGKEGTESTSGLTWDYILDVNDGWGVQLTDKTSTEAVTSKLCTFINNKPVTSMTYMFYNSQTSSINLKNFNTSYVTNMDSMFRKTILASIDVSTFNTSSVTNMYYMFADSNFTALTLNSFDTSKVKSMVGMFSGSQATSIDLSSFNTSKITDMSSMFSGSKATALDLSNFDTSHVTNMMGMFSRSKVYELDLSSFDTYLVERMDYMFSSSYNLTTIYVSDKFNVTSVNISDYMFSGSTSLVGGSGTKYNKSYVDKTYAYIDGGTSNPGYFTDIADKVEEPESFATDSWPTIINAVKNGNTGKYNVGDTKTIDMGNYGTHTLRLANKTTPSECSTSGFSQTACGFVIEFADIITKYNMNPSGTYKGTKYDYGWNVDGWPASSMYTFVNTDIYNVIPKELRNGIIDTTVVSGHGSTSGETNFTSTDKLYLLSTGEIWANGTSGSITSDTARTLTRQLDYYKVRNVTTSNYGDAIKKNEGSASYWWLRTATSYYTNYFLRVSYDGIWTSTSASTSSGVSPAFRIG